MNEMSYFDLLCYAKGEKEAQRIAHINDELDAASRADRQNRRQPRSSLARSYFYRANAALRQAWEQDHHWK